MAPPPRPPVRSRSDSNAKDVFLNRGDSTGKGFPNIPGRWWTSSEGEKWIRAQPKDPDSKQWITTPTLVRPGSEKRIHPDGMWVMVGRMFRTKNGRPKLEGFWADVMAFESSQQPANLYKDRSRYFPSIGAYQVRIPKSWLEEEITTVGRGPQKPRWQTMGSAFDHADGKRRENLDLFKDNHIRFPVRRLSVMFCLANDLYEDVRHTIVPEGHEYFMKHSTMGNRANIKKHVMKMDLENHWL